MKGVTLEEEGKGNKNGDFVDVTEVTKGKEGWKLDNLGDVIYGWPQGMGHFCAAKKKKTMLKAWTKNKRGNQKKICYWKPITCYTFLYSIYYITL